MLIISIRFSRPTPNNSSTSGQTSGLTSGTSFTSSMAVLFVHLKKSVRRRKSDAFSVLRFASIKSGVIGAHAFDHEASPRHKRATSISGGAVPYTAIAYHVSGAFINTGTTFQRIFTPIDVSPRREKNGSRSTSVEFLRGASVSPIVAPRDDRRRKTGSDAENFDSLAETGEDLRGRRHFERRRRDVTFVGFVGAIKLPVAHERVGDADSGSGSARPLCRTTGARGGGGGGGGGGGRRRRG